MRVLTPFFLTVLILVNLFGFYGIFVFEQANAKHVMAEKINDPDLSVHHLSMSFNTDEFSKLLFNENGKEFRYNGKLYDVVSIENSGTAITVVVEYDANETALVDNFGTLLNQQQDKDQSSGPVKALLSHFQQDYVVYQLQIAICCSTCVAGYCFTSQHSLPALFVDNGLTQPPEVFIS